MDRLEKEKTRIKQDIVMKDYKTAVKPTVDPMPFMKDVDRLRYRQVRPIITIHQKLDCANKKQEAIYNEYMSKMYPEVAVSNIPQVFIVVLINSLAMP